MNDGSRVGRQMREVESGFKQIGVRKATLYCSVLAYQCYRLCREHFTPHSPILVPSVSSLKGGTALS